MLQSRDTRATSNFPPGFLLLCTRTYTSGRGCMKSIYRGSFVSRQCALALLLGAFVVLFLSQSPARAQAGASTGRIEGTVTDSSGAVVPGAQIAAREETTNITATVASEDNGHFIFAYLAPGSYDLSVKKDGFDSTEIQHVEVEVGTTSSVRPQL